MAGGIRGSAAVSMMGVRGGDGEGCCGGRKVGEGRGMV